MTDNLTRIRERCDKQRQDIRDATGKDYTSARQQTFNEGAFTAYGDLLAILNESEPAGAGPDALRVSLRLALRTAEALVYRCGHPRGSCPNHCDPLVAIIDSARAALRGAAQPTPAEQPSKRAYYHEAIETVIEMRKVDLARLNNPETNESERNYYGGRAHRCDDILFWLGYIEANIPAGTPQPEGSKG